MATLTARTVVRAGVDPALVACSGGGDEFVNTGAEFILVTNGHTSDWVVTIATPATVDGLAVADRTVTIPDGESRLIGPFPKATYNSGTNKVNLTYDGVTAMTIAVLKLGA